MKKLSKFLFVFCLFAISTLQGSGYYITNNYPSTASNVYFSNSSSPVTATLEYTQSLPITVGATYLQCAYFNDMLFDVYFSNTANVNFFGSGSLTNNSSTTYYVFYQTSSQQGCNNPSMQLIPGQTLPIITNTGIILLYTSATSTGNDTPALFISPANANTNYVITANNTITSTALLTNNYNVATGDIKFISTSNTTTNISPLLPAASITITSGTKFIRLSLPAFNSLTQPFASLTLVANGNSQSIFTNSIFTNNTSSNLILYLSNSSYGTSYSGVFPINIGQSIPIATGSTAVTVADSSGSSILIPATPINPSNYSYIISNSPSWSITTYTPTLTNNGTTTATDLNFYNANNTLISPADLSFPVTPVTNIPPQSWFATMYNADLLSNLTIPIFFPYQNLFEENSSDQICTITNNTAYTIYVNYYGTVNRITGVQLNSAPSTAVYYGISVAPAATTPIILGALNISATASGGTLTPIPRTQSLTTATSYYINNSGSALTLDTSPLSAAQLTNNYFEPTGTILFSTAATTIGLQQWTSASIPSSATSAQFSQEFNGQSSTLTIPVSGSTSSNIFSNYVLFNNNYSNMTVTFYGASGALNSPGILLPVGQTIPILNNCTSIAITSSPYSYPQATPAGLGTTSYNITPGTSVLVLTPYIPHLINNYSGQTATNLTFCRSDGASIASDPNPFQTNDSVVVPATATFATMTMLNVPLTVPLTLATTSNLFTPYTIANVTNQTANISFSGPINYGINNNSIEPFNNSPIALKANDFIYIPSGATLFTAGAGSETMASQEVDDPSYFISESDDVWSISSTIPLSDAILSNTSNNQTASNVTFYNPNAYLLETIASIPYLGSTPIPQSASSATFQLTSNSVVTTVSMPVSIYRPDGMCTQAQIQNGSSTETMLFQFYSTPTSSPTTTSPYVSVAPGGTSYVPTDSLAVSVSIPSVSDQPVITQQAINGGQYVYLDTTTNQWVLSVYPEPTSYNLTNNYNGTAATGLTFYNGSISTGTGPNPFSYNQQTSIPSTTTFAQLTFLGSTDLIIPINDTTSSSLITPNVITNNSGGQIGIAYWGTINGESTQLNTSSNLIYVANGANSPILMNAISFTIYSNGTAVLTQAITSGTSYVITSGFPTPTPITNIFYLTNNGNSANVTTGMNTTFYNASTSLGNLGDLNVGSSVAITTGATNVQTTLSFNNSGTSTSLKIPASYTASSNLFASDSSNNPYTITNNSGQTVAIVFYGPVPGSVMNTTINLNSGLSVPILYGASTLSVTGTSISNVAISQSSNYYIYEENSIWYLTTYPSTATVTNNYTGATPSNLQFYNSSGTIGSTVASFTTTQAIPMPTNATWVTLTESSPIASAWTLPVIGTTTSSLFSSSIIFNNASTASAQSATLTFFGTVNGSPQQLNAAPIVLAPQTGIYIPNGAGNAITVLLTQNSTTYTLQTNTPYFFDYIDGTWSLNTYGSSAALFNNYNAGITNLTFNVSTNSGPQTVQAQGSVAVPTNSTTTTFTDAFNNSPAGSSFTIPISSTASGSIFSSSTITNAASQQVTITFLGTVAGIANTPFNSTAAPLNPTNIMPVFNNTTSFQVNATSGGFSNPVIDTSTLYTPLPLNQPYTISYSGGVWSLLSGNALLMNNLNEPATSLTFYNSSGTAIVWGYNEIPSWGAIPIAPGAASVEIEYLSTTVVLQITTQYDMNVFTNGFLLNNSDEAVSVTFQGQVGSNSAQPLNTEPFFLAPGEAYPFLTGTSSITITANDDAITLYSPVTSTLSYEISTALTTRQIAYNDFASFRAANPSIEQSTSALGVLRFLGGVAQTALNNSVVNLYAKNSTLFEQFLYVTTYAQIITNSAARTATVQAVNDIITAYAISYRNQSNFNYISYFYLIQDDLAAAQAALIILYPTSTSKINKFFTYLQKRITILSA